MKINGKQWKSMKNNENQWDFQNIMVFDLEVLTHLVDEGTSEASTRAPHTHKHHF